MSNRRKSFGNWGERLAAAYLEQKGYTILERNVRTPYGEIDLVTCQETQPGWVTVFVEVKARHTSAFGPPEAAITPKKSQHLLESAQAYLQAHPELDGDWRIDVIAIRRVRGGEAPQVRHFEDAVH
ncbi:MAG: YraN family protein [Anaerolineales bacterium]